MGSQLSTGLQPGHLAAFGPLRRPTNEDRVLTGLEGICSLFIHNLSGSTSPPKVQMPLRVEMKPVLIFKYQEKSFLR